MVFIAMFVSRNIHRQPDGIGGFLFQAFSVIAYDSCDVSTGDITGKQCYYFILLVWHLV